MDENTQRDLDMDLRSYPKSGYLERDEIADMIEIAVSKGTSDSSFWARLMTLLEAVLISRDFWQFITMLVALVFVLILISMLLDSNLFLDLASLWREEAGVATDAGMPIPEMPEMPDVLPGFGGSE